MLLPRAGRLLCHSCVTTYLQPNMSVFVVDRHPRCFRGCSIHPPAILKCNVQHILSQTHLALYLIIILMHLFSPWHPLVFVMFILLLISASFLPDMPTLLLLPSSPVGLQYPLLRCISSALTVRPVACPRLFVKPSWSRCIPLSLQLPYQVISLSNEILLKLVGSSFL